MADLKTARPARDPLRRVLTEYAWEHRGSYLLGVLLLAATNYITVTIPIEIGASVDALTSGQPLGRHALIIGVLGVLMMGVRTASRVLFFNPGRDIEYAIRRDIFTRLMALQPSFYAGHRRGDLVSRASNDITSARALIGFGGLAVANLILAMSMSGWKMVSMSPKLTLVSLVPILLGLVLVQGGIRQLFTLMRRNQAELGTLSDHVLGSFQGMATIHGFAAEDAFVQRFDEKNDAWYATGVRLALVRALFLPVLAMTGGLSLFTLVYFGGPMVLDGLLTVGDIAAFAALLATLMPLLRSVGFLLNVIQRGRASLERLFELIDAPIDRPEGDVGVVLPRGAGPALSLRGLDFAYPDAPDKPVLHDLRVDIPAGALVGLFGRTGSGKTTLLRVLSRLHNPPRGTVSVDGVDLLDLDLPAWRQRMALVPQRPFLFSDSIRENVALDEQIDESAVERAVGLASLTADLAALPRGLDTVVGERGILLSGGQRQRVALARGLYQERDAILLDDVLSAVDHQTEARLVEALRGVARGRAAEGGGAPTTFIASHRLSALRSADLILVLDEGRLVDVGRHAELINRPGLYQETWAVQREDGGADEVAS